MPETAGVAGLELGVWDEGKGQTFEGWDHRHLGGLHNTRYLF